MKKIYVSPLATEVKIEAEQMLAASLEIKNPSTNGSVNTDEDWGQLSNRPRGEWGNLWAK